MPKRRFIQRKRENGSTFLEEVRVPPRSDFQTDDKSYLDKHPDYKGYKFVKTVKSKGKLKMGYKLAIALTWERIFGKRDQGQVQRV